MSQIPDAAVQAAITAGCMEGWDHIEERMRDALTAALPHLPLGFEVKQLEWEYICEYCLEYRAKTSIGTYSIHTDEDSAAGRMFCYFHLTEDGDCTKYGEEIYSGYGEYETIKSAAQADFEHRVRECLVGQVLGSHKQLKTEIAVKGGYRVDAYDLQMGGKSVPLSKAITLTNGGTNPFDVAAVRKQALEEAATLIDEGFDKPVGKAWRNDGKASKNDKCPHDQYMYEDCEPCAANAIRSLSTSPTLEAGRAALAQGGGE